MVSEKIRETACLTVFVDDHLEVHTHYKGNPGLILPMIGGIEYARAWCLEQLRAREQPLCVDDKSKQNLLVTVTRKEALEQYYVALDTLRARIAAVSSSAPDATFQVPSYLPQL